MTLRVKLEIIPYGDEDKAYEIGRMDIFNKGPEMDHRFYRYGVISLDKNAEGLFDTEIVHKRELGAWPLVAQAIKELAIEGPN